MTLDDSKYAAAVRRVYGSAVDGLTCCGIIHRPGDGYATVEFAKTDGVITRGPKKGHFRWVRGSEQMFTISVGQLEG